MDYKFTLVIKNIHNTGGVVEQLLALFDVSYISIEAETGQLVTPYEEYSDMRPAQAFYDEDGNLEEQVDLDAIEAEEMDDWYLDEDGHYQLYGSDDGSEESEIDDEYSAFVGVPKDDETIIPHHVALDIARSLEEEEDVLAAYIARSLEEEEEKVPVKPSADIYKVVGVSKQAKLTQTFDSVAEAALKTGTRSADIARVLRGDRKSANGWSWSKAPFTLRETESDELTEVLPSSAAHQSHGTIYGGLPHGTKE